MAHKGMKSLKDGTDETKGLEKCRMGGHWLSKTSGQVGDE